MEKLERDILKAQALIKDNKIFASNFERFDHIYPFTNENIKSSLEPYHLENTDCLTVLGSSDQTLDMCLQGATNITTFDLNPLTEYYFYLKKAALLTNLTLEEYLQFFCYLSQNGDNKINTNTFNLKTFEKISPNLPHNSYIFWSTLFDKYSPHQIRSGNGLFSFGEEFKIQILNKTINHLSSSTNYELLKERIKDLKFTFINSDINNLPNILNQKYDLMYFSNIIQYIDEMYSNISDNKIENQIYKLNQFKELVYKLGEFLKDDGNIMTGYLYNIQRPSVNAAILNKRLRDQVFNNKDFMYHFFKSVSELRFSIKQNDACLVYSKK